MGCVPRWAATMASLDLKYLSLMQSQCHMLSMASRCSRPSTNFLQMEHWLEHEVSGRHTFDSVHGVLHVWMALVEVAGDTFALGLRVQQPSRDPLVDIFLVAATRELEK